MIDRKKIISVILLLGLVVMALIFSYWFFRFRPLVWTEKHGEELSYAIEQAVMASDNYRNDRNKPQLLDVTTGEVLDNALTGPDSTDWERISLILNTNADVITVLRYSDSSAIARARVETGGVSVLQSTGKAVSPCRGTAFEAEFLLIREDGKWKLAEVQHYESDTVTPVEAIRQSVCPTNWEEQLEDWFSDQNTNN